MARDNLQDNIGIAWDPDPDADVFEYLVFWTDDDSDFSGWMTRIDDGQINPDAVVTETQFVFPPGHPPGLDYAVVSHGRNATTGLERWSSPYSPSEWQDVPLDLVAPALEGPSGGRLLSAG